MLPERIGKRNTTTIHFCSDFPEIYSDIIPIDFSLSEFIYATKEQYSLIRPFEMIVDKFKGIVSWNTRRRLYSTSKTFYYHMSSPINTLNMYESCVKLANIMNDNFKSLQTGKLIYHGPSDNKNATYDFIIYEELGEPNANGDVFAKDFHLQFKFMTEQISQSFGIDPALIGEDRSVEQPINKSLEDISI